MKFLIVDDHPTLRAGLKQILADGFAAAEFGEAATAQETLALLDQGNGTCCCWTFSCRAATAWRSWRK